MTEELDLGISSDARVKGSKLRRPTGAEGDYYGGRWETRGRNPLKPTESTPLPR